MNYIKKLEREREILIDFLHDLQLYAHSEKFTNNPMMNVGDIFLRVRELGAKAFQEGLDFELKPSPAPVELAENLDGFISVEELTIHLDKMGKMDTPESYLLYGDAKSKAMKCRLAGNIEDALVFERACDKYYRDIPNEWKW